MDRVNRRIDLQTCRDHHEAIRTMLGLFPKTAPFDAAAVADWLARLARILQRHLKLEDGFLYPALFAAGDRTLRETAVRYQNEMGGLSGEFAKLLTDWSQADAIAQRPQEFLAAWEPFRERLEVRMAKEDHGLYEIADEYLKHESGP